MFKSPFRLLLSIKFQDEEPACLCGAAAPENVLHRHLSLSKKVLIGYQTQICSAHQTLSRLMSLSNQICGCFCLLDRKLGLAWKSEPGHPFRARVWGARQCYWWKPYSYLLIWLMYAHHWAGRALVDCGSAGFLHHHLHHPHKQTGLLQKQAVRREDPRRQLSEKKWPTEPNVSEKL